MKEVEEGGLPILNLKNNSFIVACSWSLKNCKKSFSRTIVNFSYKLITEFQDSKRLFQDSKGLFQD